MLRIPMRGYEIENWINNRIYGNVTHPHEGLWALIRLKSMGVMKWLRIPMRGYEILIGYFFLLNDLGYASPWGVMRTSVQINHNGRKLLRIPMRGYEIVKVSIRAHWFSKLRIPMRGYERFTCAVPCPCWYVTHPHEGLWVPNRYTGTRKNMLRIPMRGYEDDRKPISIPSW